MLLVELFISVPIFPLYVLASILLFQAARKSPIIEMKLLAFTSFISLPFFAGMILTAFINTPNKLNPLTEVIFRIGFVFGQLCMLAISFTFILPDYKFNYSSIVLISVITAVSTASILINGITLDLHITEIIIIHYHPLGLFLFIISSCLIFFVVIKRLITVSKVIRQKVDIKISIRTSLIMSIIMGSSLILLIVLDIFVFTVPIPGYSYTIPFLFGGIYLNYIIKKDPSLFFLTSASLDAVIMIDQQSYLVIFSRTFIQSSDPYSLKDWQLIGGFFSAINISLGKAIQSDSGIEQISFGDKCVLTTLGQRVACLLIVSERNFITDAISRFLVKQFEKLYQEKLDSISSNIKHRPIKTADFDDFELVVASIRRYLPL